MHIIEAYLRDAEDACLWLGYFTNWPTINEILISSQCRLCASRLKDILVFLKPENWQDWSLNGPRSWQNSIFDGDGNDLGLLVLNQISVIENEGWEIGNL